LFGLVAGPLLLYLAGTLVIELQSSKTRKVSAELKRNHNIEVKKLRKEYDKDRELFNKKAKEMEKIIAKAKGA